jgi:UDP-2-acetamido-3-amino-2,3-dideoxy-glucuronate N-acetyltransferase
VGTECELSNSEKYFIADTARVDDTAIIGEGTKIWDDAKIYPGVAIGRNCVIGAGVHLEHGVVIGDYCKIQRGVTVYSGVEMADYCFVGPNATFTNDRNPRAFGPWQLTKTILDTGASIGANATVVCGSRVGSLALVGAGAVVTKNVEPFSLVVGNPAHRVGWVDVGGNVISRASMLPEEIQQLLGNEKRAIELYLNGDL